MKTEGKILIVDDENGVLKLAQRILTNSNFSVETATTAKDALSLLGTNNFDLIILDNFIPETPGLELAKHIQKKDRSCEIIIMTGLPDKNLIDDFRELGIVYFIFKPFHELQMIYTVHAALYHSRLKSMLVGTDDLRGSKIVGSSKNCQHLRSEIVTFASSTLPILIMGETGTGKEVIANEIHRFSGRSSKPFIPVNCASLGTLANTQLFGHIKGAFTGAIRTTKGFIGAADGGTLFLDEVGDLTKESQVNLLRFLDTGEYTTVGEETPRTADVRIICATNKDLRDGIKEEWFREDLFYRIAGSIIETEPLRNRPEDIPLLVCHFIEVLGEEQQKSFKISPRAIHALNQFSWPGNVRQLLQVLRVLTQRRKEKEISYADVIREIGPVGGTKLASYREAKNKVIREFDQEYFSQLLFTAGGSLKKILEISEMHKKNFYDKIKEYGLSTKLYKSKNVSQPRASSENNNPIPPDNPISLNA